MHSPPGLTSRSTGHGMAKDIASCDQLKAALLGPLVFRVEVCRQLLDFRLGEGAGSLAPCCEDVVHHVVQDHDEILNQHLNDLPDYSLEMLVWVAPEGDLFAIHWQVRRIEL